MEKDREDELFGFTHKQIFEAIRKFQAMDSQDAKDFLQNNPLAKAIMLGGQKPKPKATND